MLTEKEIEKLIDRIVTCIQPRQVIIFGSYAKGTATTRSDLDMLVIKETELPMKRRGDIFRHITANSLIPLDIHIYTPEEVEVYGREQFSFINSILKTGKTVFEK
jgi:predicted nucleotidyltransferase